MTAPSDDQFLRDALSDAVDDLEPADRLAAIRARTGPTARRDGRSWFVVGGAALAAAACVVAVAVLAGAQTDDGVDSAATPTSTPVTIPPTHTPSRTTPVYYVGPGPDGPTGPEVALYRYFEPADDPLDLLMSPPSDPDYRTLWPAGSLLSYELTPTEIVVQVADQITGAEDVAWQQVIYTLQATSGSVLPVRFEHSEVDLGEVVRRPPLEVLSHVSISDPGEGYAYGDSFTARGVGTGFEGTIACRLVAPGGDEVWRAATIAGADDALSPWEIEVDLTDVQPGRYTVVCQNDDPTGGSEGRGADVDTRSITVTTR